ncbi:MAG: GNAT family N-acetyltransferase [Atopobiaceae bacterium]|nr:GNAT family N-acetyltransferase [Atopobiaceae bacterium]
MGVERANIADADELVELRVAYLTEDNGVLDEGDEVAIRDGLPGYFGAHLGHDLHAYVVREGGRIASCAFLIVVEKPMSPAFINGRTGIVLNVYTRPDCRRRGYAKRVMEALLAGAEALDLSVVELQATDDGYPLYLSVGFLDDESKYHRMKWFGR